MKIYLVRRGRCVEDSAAEQGRTDGGWGIVNLSTIAFPEWCALRLVPRTPNHLCAARLSLCVPANLQRAHKSKHVRYFLDVGHVVPDFLLGVTFFVAFPVIRAKLSIVTNDFTNGGETFGLHYTLLAFISKHPF